MKIAEVYDRRRTPICEQGYGRVYEFEYGPHRVDPTPKVFVLGRYRHPTTGNILVAGINLNYLAEDEISRLRQNLSPILAERTLNDRYWKGRELIPDIFKVAYRTYRQDEIVAVSREVIRKWPSEGAREEEERRRKWREMSPEERTAIRRQRAKEAHARRQAAEREKPTSAQRRRPPEYD